MVKEYLEFKQERDLGAIITDAFKFIRLEWKNFFKTVFSYAIIPIILAVVGVIYYLSSFGDIANGTPNMALMMIALVIAMIASLIAMVLINLAGMYYIKSYIDNKGVVNQQEIKTNVKSKFWSFVGFGVLAYIILVISVMLCVLPVFYTMTVLSLGASILVFENESATSALGKCFEFVKGHFWQTLGVIIVVAFLIGVLSMVFQVPVLIYQFVKMATLTNGEDPAQVMSLFKDPIYLGLYFLSMIGQYLFYAITLITNVFLYFDINEQKNATGSFEKIDALGQ